MTAKPGGDEAADQLRDLNKIGDNHMPEDLREAEREKSETSEESAESAEESFEEEG